MLKLGGRVIEIKGAQPATTMLFSVSTNKLLPKVLKESKAYLVDEMDVPEDFAHYLILDSKKDLIESIPPGSEFTILPEDYAYLGNNDVIRLSSDRSSIRVLFRETASNNSILITEQCNHYCLMCSQPPKAHDDSWIIEETFKLIPLIPKTTKEIGFTGGEPTLFGDRFLELLRYTKSELPITAIHILSNGRSFKSEEFSKKYSEINHFDMMVGIPIYSDDPAQHDYIVQAKGAFDETIQGILNLKRLGQKVEIRIVLHKQSITRLINLCEFIGRNLIFVDHVALMGLEMIGFTRANLEELWIDPIVYRDTLSEAVGILAAYGLSVSVYNHQLCLVNSDIKPYYRKSISDWKNEFAPECAGCKKISECGGFFSSGIQNGYSKNLLPFQ
ncbi:MAG TPA: His-Xaa-Ser system radical SAM maturase HxsC [Methylophilaceae bacterium]|nr:His-Xaa-Ser system radical SAM maturase HxsC [Methylophilaceae bacterium]